MRFLIGLRLVGLLTGAVIGYAMLPRDSYFSRPPDPTVSGIWLFSWMLIGFTLLPYLAVVPTRAVRRELSAMSAGQLVMAVGGGLAGMVAGLIVGFPLQGLPGDAGVFIALFTSLAFGAGLSGIALVRSHDLLRLIGREPAPVASRLVSASGGLVLDTSALIDGRIVEVVRLGLSPERIGVSRATVDELRILSDDPNRHAKGVRGQEALNALRAIERIRLEIVADAEGDGRDADARILTLAATRGGILVTTDAALERAAIGAGVAVVNVHGLADQLLSVVAAGDVVRVRAEERGREPGQAAGHLADGTLVIIEGGAEYVGREIEVTVSRLVRTGGGRIVFARPRPRPAGKADPASERQSEPAEPAETDGAIRIRRVDR